MEYTSGTNKIKPTMIILYKIMHDDIRQYFFKKKSVKIK